MFSTYFFLVLLSILVSCEQTKKKYTDSEELLKVYASEYVQEENEFIYYRAAENIQQFKKAIGIPITFDRLEEITDLVKDVRLDSLITPVILKVWNKKITNYKSIYWNQDKLSKIPFISEGEISDFFFEGGIPREGEKVVKVHFVSTPIIYNNVALLFFSQRTSPQSGSAGYHIYAKLENHWQLIAVNNIIWTN